MKKIGILGGIGPEATSYFYTQLIQRVRGAGNVRRNIDYPQIIINSMNAPELVSPVASKDDLEPYIRGIRELALLNPEYIVMACNTIHLFRDEIIEQSGYEKISDIKQIVTQRLATVPGTISVIGTQLTVSGGLYTDPERTYINPDARQLALIGEVVVNYNAHGETLENKKKLLEIIGQKKQDGADVFIAGCTEVSELLQGETNDTIIDTLELLIDDTVQRIIR